MKVLKEHYEKVALIVGGLVLLLGVYFGINSFGAADDYIAANRGGKPGPLPKGVLDQPATKALQELNAENKLALDFDPLKPSREIYMFKSIALYGRQGQKTPIDIVDPKAAQVHPPIPNSYWSDNQIGEQLIYENALQLDPDKDGFTNEEEFQAKTNPNDAKSHPDLIDKVGAEAIDVQTINFSYNEAGSGRIFPKFVKKPGNLRINERAPLSKGGKFPSAPRNNDIGEYEKRYEYIDLEGKGVNKLLKIKDTLTGIIISVPKDRAGIDTEDLTAVLYLDALGKGNDPGVKLRSGQQFSLPFGGAPLSYKVDSIKKKEETGNLYIITISGPNGKKREITASSR